MLVVYSVWCWKLIFDWVGLCCWMMLGMCKRGSAGRWRRNQLSSLGWRHPLCGPAIQCPPQVMADASFPRGLVAPLPQQSRVLNFLFASCCMSARKGIPLLHIPLCNEMPRGLTLLHKSLNRYSYLQMTLDGIPSHEKHKEVFFSDEEPRMGFTSIPRNKCKRKLGYTGLLGDICDQGNKTVFQETSFKRD